MHLTNLYLAILIDIQTISPVLLSIIITFMLSLKGILNSLINIAPNLHFYILQYIFIFHALEIYTNMYIQDGHGLTLFQLRLV